MCCTRPCANLLLGGPRNGFKTKSTFKLKLLFLVSQYFPSMNVSTMRAVSNDTRSVRYYKFSCTLSSLNNNTTLGHCPICHATPTCSQTSLTAVLWSLLFIYSLPIKIFYPNEIFNDIYHYLIFFNFLLFCFFWRFLEYSYRCPTLCRS